MHVSHRDQQSESPLINQPVNMSDLKARDLYGGALCVHLPARFDDVSAFRHVPNHQEVFADAEHDSSIIIEINEQADESDVKQDEQTAAYYSNELAESEMATDYRQIFNDSMTGTSTLPSHVTSCSFCVSQSRIRKYRDADEQQANTIMTMLYCLRLPKYTSDLLLIHNVPIAISASSSSANAADVPVAVTGAATDATTDDELALISKHRPIIDQALASLQIKDYKLFG